MGKYPLIETVNKLSASAPFVGPEAQERASGSKFIARLGANENGFGPSPKALAAMVDYTHEIWMYGDPESYELREEIASFHGIGIENIVVDSSIDALLSVVCRLYVEPGRKVVTSAGAYPTFNFHVIANGGELNFLPLENDRENIIGLNELAKDTGSVLSYVSNPNNPMGSWQTEGAMVAMIDQLPEGNVLILDEAYVEFAPDYSAPPIDINNPKLLRFRTFSKAYGMAGARIGYCIGEAGHIRQFEKLRNHFGINRIAQIGALAAFKDQEYLQDVVCKITESKKKISVIAENLGFTALPSAANFVAIDCGRDGEYSKSIMAELANRNVFIRLPGVAPQSRCIRVSAGPDDEIEIFAKALSQVVEKLG